MLSLSCKGVTRKKTLLFGIFSQAMQAIKGAALQALIIPCASSLTWRLRLSFDASRRLSAFVNVNHCEFFYNSV